MPRIPTSKPEDVRSKPSVGGQVNINSQDSFFRSIASASAEVGQLVEQAKIEKQKAIDAKEANQVKIFQDERAAELEARLRDADISEHSAIIDGFAAQTKRLSFNPGVSKATREALQQDHNLWTQRLYSNSMSWSAQKAEQDKMATAEQVIANSVNSMNVNRAYAAIESLNISPELKQARKNEALATIAKKQKENINANRIERNAAIKDSMDVAYQKGLSENLDLIKADARNKGVWNDELESNYLQYKKGVEKKKIDEQKESDNAISAELLTNTNAFALQNNLQGIEEQIKILDSGKGLAAGMTEIKRLATKNSMLQARNGIVARRAKAFDDVLKKAVDVGVLNDETLSDMKDMGLLTDEQEVQMRSIFSSTQRTEELNKQFNTDKADVLYKTVYNELGEKFLEKFAEGDSVQIDEDEIKEYDKRIDSLPLGIIAKNKLKSRLALAASVAILEDDFDIGVQLGEEWEELPPERREILAGYAKEVSSIMLESTRAQLALTKQGDKTEYPSLADVLIEDLNFLAKEFNAGVDPKELNIPSRLRLYRVGSQQLRIREFLLTPSIIEE